MILQSLKDNCKTSELGHWEPFRSRTLKSLYFQEQLNFENVEAYAHNSIDSNELREYFVDSFTNFKSFEVDEKQNDNEEWKATPSVIKQYNEHYDFVKELASPQQGSPTFMKIGWKVI